MAEGDRPSVLGFSVNPPAPRAVRPAGEARPGHDLRQGRLSPGRGRAGAQEGGGDRADRARGLPLADVPDPDRGDARESPGQHVLQGGAAGRRGRGRRLTAAASTRGDGPRGRPHAIGREGTMIPEFSVSVSPIVPWPVLIGVIGTVTVLTLWAYRRRLRGTSGALAVGRAVAPAAGDPALPAGGAAALGRAPGEGEAAGVAGLPGRRHHQHEHQRRGRRQDALGGRQRDARAGARRGQEAGARPRRQVLPVRFDASRSPRRAS